MKHYVCTGECHGVSSVPKSCDALGCHKKGEPLVECECNDGKHKPAFEKIRWAMSGEKKKSA